MQFLVCENEHLEDCDPTDASQNVTRLDATAESGRSTRSKPGRRMPRD
jgi:hypothetical protein